MENKFNELQKAWLLPSSPIYLTHDVKEIKKYCDQNGLDMQKEEITKFLEKSKSSNLKAEDGKNKKIREVSKKFVLRSKMFSQLHADIFMLSKSRSYNTTLRYIFIIACSLSSFLLVEPLSSLKFEFIKKAFENLMVRIKDVYPSFDSKGATLFTDFGGEWASSSFLELLKKYGMKRNLIRLREFRKSKGSGFIEKSIRQYRLMFERVNIEHKDIPFREKLRRAENACNNTKAASLKMAPSDAILMRPLDVVSLKMDYRLRNRKYLLHEIVNQKEIAIGTIVRVKYFVSKSFHSTVKESYSRYSCYFIITSCDKTREIYTYSLSDIFTFVELNGSYNRYELKICDINLFDACAKMERRVKKVTKKKDDLVWYESFYRDYVFCAKKSLIDG